MVTPKLVKGPEHFAEILYALGVSMPGLKGWVTIVVELVGCGISGAAFAFDRLVAKSKSKRAIPIEIKV